MIKVSNAKIINKIALKSFKANKLRNIFATIAILLTAVLFTGLFTVGSSLLASMEESTMRQVGGSSHGGFKYLNMEQYEKLTSHPLIKEASYSVLLGAGDNKELIKRPTEIRYASGDTLAERFFSLPTTGRMPESGKEIATDTLVLDRLGIPAELGQQVTLEYKLSDKLITDTFTLVGFWEGDKISMASQAWLSPEYVKAKLEGYTPMYDGDAVGKIFGDVMFANSRQIESKMIQVIEESGYKVNEIKYGVNWAYVGNTTTLDAGGIIAIGCALLLIIFCGYLIISNVFYIGVAKDIRSYGLLKTLGTTSKQIRKIIRNQALLLSFIAIPIGLVAGYGVGFLIFPLITSMTTLDLQVVSVNYLVFVAAAAFALITVWISTLKPARLAGKVSPIEALRNTDATSKKKTKKGKNVSLFTMAKGNISRNRKRAFVVVLSISLSLIILNCTYSYVNSFDMDAYLKSYAVNDYTVASAAYFNVHADQSNMNDLDNGNIEEIFSQQGISGKGRVFLREAQQPVDASIELAAKKSQEVFDLDAITVQVIQESLERQSVPSHIYGVDELAFNSLEILQGDLDYAKFLTGDYIIVSAFDDKGQVLYYQVGDKVVLDLGDGKSKEYEVMAIGSIPHSISARHSHMIDPNFILPSEEFIAQIGNVAPLLISFDVDDASQNQMEEYLKDYTTNVDDTLEFESRASLAAEFETMQKSMLIVGLVISGIIAFIGIMNFVNTITTSIISRRQEMAMLQSIGMTNKQTRVVLAYEGIIYLILTSIASLTVGSVIGYILISTITGASWTMTASFTVIPSLFCLPVFLLIAVLVPLVAYKYSNSKSVVERLREVE